MSERLKLKVARITDETGRIKSLRLEREGGGRLPLFSPGSHFDLFLPNGLVRQYSLINHPSENDHYLIGVLKERQSRGATAWIHENLSEGTVLEAGLPRNNFHLDPGARTSLLIAGGIGVTPLLSMASHLHRQGADFTFYFCTRDRAETPFLARIADEGWGAHLHLVHDGGDPSQGLDVEALLAEVPEGGHLYCCGPAGLMAAVRAASAHWPPGRVHFESFAPEAETLAGGENRAFTIVLAKSGRELAVPADKTIVEVLRANGIEVETLCEEGVCGTCITDVIAGEPEHRDSVLTDEEHASNALMTVCCSRAKGEKLVLDL